MSIAWPSMAAGASSGPRAVKEAATTFVAALRPDDPLALVQFADDVMLAHDLSTKRQTSIEAISGHGASGGTALWDALHDSIALLDAAGSAASGGGRDRRPRREQSGHRARQPALRSTRS